MGIYHYLEITDGTTSVLIMSSTGTQTSYRLKYGGWAPNVAKRRRSKLGGVSDYEDVLEELTLNIHGTTAHDALNKLEDLYNLLDQAERWMNNEPVAAVKIKYQIAGSQLTNPLEAIIIGRQRRSDTQPLQVDNDLTSVGDFNIIKNVNIRFWRRGLWVSSSETVTVAAAANPAVLTTSFSGTIGALHNLVRVDLTGFIAGVSGTQTTVVPKGFVLIADDDDKIASATACTGAAFNGGANPDSDPVTLTTVNDSANLPVSGTHIARFTFTSGIASVYIPTPLANNIITRFPPADASDNCAVSVFASIRTNSLIDWSFSSIYLNSTQFGAVVDAAPISVRGDSIQPRYVYLGTFIHKAHILGSCNQINLRFSHGSGVSSSIDFDNFVYLVQDSQNNVIAIEETNTGLLNGTASFSLSLDHRYTSDPIPFVGGIAVPFLNFPRDTPIGYTGNPVTMLPGNEIAVSYLTTRGTYWRAVRNDNANQNIGLSAVRQFCYLVPR